MDNPAFSMNLYYVMSWFYLKYSLIPSDGTNYWLKYAFQLNLLASHALGQTYFYQSEVFSAALG